MKVIIISDTHIHSQKEPLPKQLLKAIAGSDLILHAGDLVDISMLRRLEKLKPTIAVAGNMDSCELKKILPQKKIIKLEGFKIGLTHGHGIPHHLLETVKEEFKNIADMSCVIYGHSHAPDIKTLDGVIYLNPGSPNCKIFAPYNTYAILDINNTITPQIIRID